MCSGKYPECKPWNFPIIKPNEDTDCKDFNSEKEYYKYLKKMESSCPQVETDKEPA